MIQGIALKAILGTVGALLLAGGLWAAWSHYTGLLRANEALRGQIVQAVDAANRNAASVRLLEAQRAADREELSRLDNRTRAIAEEAQNVAAALNTYRDRLDRAAVAKPALVARRATAAVGRVLDGISAASRHRGADGADRAGAPAAAGADPAGPGDGPGRGAGAGR